MKKEGDSDDPLHSACCMKKKKKRDRWSSESQVSFCVFMHPTLMQHAACMYALKSYYQALNAVSLASAMSHAYGGVAQGPATKALFQGLLLSP